MTFLLTLLVLIAGVLLTQKGIPWLFRKVLGLFGIQLRTSPLGQKRLRRFRSIRRGYISFVIITSCFTTSLFLEVLVNDRPIMIRYGETTAFPAVRDLGNTWLFFVDGPFSTFDRSGDFGIPGDGPLDYKAFGEIVSDPAGAFGPIEQSRKEDAKQLVIEINETRIEIDELVEDGEEPDEWLVEDLEAAQKDLDQLNQQIADLGSILEVFSSGRASVVWPLYRHGPKKNRLDLPGTAPHGPSLPIPGITPGNSTAELISANQSTLGGRPTYQIIPTNGSELQPGQKFFVVEGGNDEAVTDVLGILLVRSLSPDGQQAMAEVLSQSEGKSFPQNSPLVTRFLDTWEAPLGTNDSGIDVLPLILYGFRVSVGFAAMVMGLGYIFGILAGAVMGYYGGWTDILLQRFIEIWGSVPFLFLIMIIASIVDPGFWMLVIFLVVLRSWMAVTYQIRGEFYREKAKDYVQAAIGTGVGDFKVMVRHILPNSMIPVISRAPFSFVNYISALVSLDFLGFGLPP
ncbi:MAG: ABC transporter permease subunit, partial [Planctomycetota bacterium]